jgi:WD40-like Beta Propeller Repeat
MSVRRVEQRLRSARAPGELDAASRSLEVVRAGFAAREPRPSASRVRMRIAVAVAIALLAGALVLSPAGAKVAHLVGNAFDGPGVRHAKPALVSLPAPGRLLVDSRAGTWIVQADGSKRLLGPFHDPTWSPHGLFVGAVRGRELLAVDPKGAVRWSLARDGAAALPAWSPDGFRIAYRSGLALRVVAGDGTGDRLIARRTESVRAAWRPGTGHLLAFLADQQVRLIDADSSRVRWSRAVFNTGGQLGWARDGRTLVVAGPLGLRLLDSRGHVVRTLESPPGWRLREVAVSPHGDALALVRQEVGSGRSEVLRLRLGGRRSPPQRLFTGAGRIDQVEWSPDARWLLLAWRDADQWLFVRSSAERGLRAYSGIAATFDPRHAHAVIFPSAAGWCCGR